MDVQRFASSGFAWFKDYGYNSRLLPSQVVSSIACQLLRDLQNCRRHHEVREFLYFDCNHIPYILSVGRV